MTRLIPAYDINWFDTEKDKDDYIKRTTIFNNYNEVLAALKIYVKEYATDDDVKTILNTYIDNKKLLRKTHIVKDLSERNCTMQIFTDTIRITRDGIQEYCCITDKNKILNCLLHFTNNAETVFIILDTRSYKDFCDYWDWLVPKYTPIKTPSLTVIKRRNK